MATFTAKPAFSETSRYASPRLASDGPGMSGRDENLRCGGVLPDISANCFSCDGAVTWRADSVRLVADNPSDALATLWPDGSELGRAVRFRAGRLAVGAICNRS
jgi:hypothetical protein